MNLSRRLFINLCKSNIGTGEAGKSTFIKQMRIIHGQGYSEGDRKKFALLVYRNIYTAIQTLIDAMEVLKIPYEDDEAAQRAPMLNEVMADTSVTISDEDYRAIKGLWADGGVKSCYQRRREFQITDSAK